MKAIMNDMKLVSLAIVLAGFTQFLTNGTAPTEMVHSFIAMSVIVFLSLVAKKYIPSSLPTFAYATIIGILICLPETPVRTYFLESVGKIQFLSVCVPLLAFAGLSVGGQMEELKKMSWKVIVIFLVVATSCFFGASVIAQIGFQMKGII
ncbi:hypothetical protein AL542_14660 [Grimontia hollisae]|uniref:DUF340 domain-containing protein n=2 Tax=Grimontia hollisae TaxID=673 RepID=D0I6U2_GRIHO|nr:hypothetical protein [Grimontia hollisae]AMG31458.1 hypothetical protein AL542_14660 [Grimontia hollisae]EEY72361.1 hypothetical protein VHA_001461 [Grimontia hollisae CIP 101886]MDF2185827.1 hypothetical protein [Grimontia hollisae]STO45588.1 Uncharacterised protein [Grimontia hollisae]STO57945.1 Uncharacterised protein [Grimontia hollisae]